MKYFIINFQINTLSKQMTKFRKSWRDVKEIETYNNMKEKMVELSLRKQFHVSVDKRLSNFDEKLSEYLAKWGDIKNPRKLQIDHLQKLYRLTDHEIGRIVQANYISMTPKQRDDYFQKIKDQAMEIWQNKDLQELLAMTIQNNELRKTDNLRKSMDLPPVNEMTNEQLKWYIEMLDSFSPSQTFLGPRMLQTIDLTSFKGTRTVKDLAHAIARESKKYWEPVSYEEIMARYKTMAMFKEEGKWLPPDTKTTKSIDYYMNDAYLTESENPTIRALVGEYWINQLTQEKNFLSLEKKINDLAIKSRRSISRWLGDILVPEDKQVFNYIESYDKPSLAKTMTPEQLDLANAIISFMTQARDYLVQNQQLNRVVWDDRYITHLEKSWLEKIKNYGLKHAITHMFTKQQSLDFMALWDTSEVLGMEKFFKYALSRKELGMDPTKNATRAILRYAKAFYTKVALDTTIPKIQAMSYVLADGKTQKFVKEWLNNKKGRRIDYRMQWSKVEQIGLFLKSLTSALYIWFNPIIALWSIVGSEMSSRWGQMNASGCTNLQFLVLINLPSSGCAFISGR